MWNGFTHSLLDGGMVALDGASAAKDAAVATLVRVMRMKETFHRSHFAMWDGVFVLKPEEGLPDAIGWRAVLHPPLDRAKYRDVAAPAHAPSDAGARADGSCWRWFGWPMPQRYTPPSVGCERHHQVIRMIPTGFPTTNPTAD